MRGVAGLAPVQPEEDHLFPGEGHLSVQIHRRHFYFTSREKPPDEIDRHDKKDLILLSAGLRRSDDSPSSEDAADS